MNEEVDGEPTAPAPSSIAMNPTTRNGAVTEATEEVSVKFMLTEFILYYEIIRIIKIMEHTWIESLGRGI